MKPRPKSLCWPVAFALAVTNGSKLDLAAAVTCAMGPTDRPKASVASADLLTTREWQVAELVAQGLTNKAIAAQLVIAPRTAESHVERVLQKLGFNSRLQVVTWMAERGVSPR